MIKHRNGINWTIILVLILVPVFLLLFVGTGIQNISNYSFNHLLGQILGLVGFSAFSLTLLLSSKFNFVEKMTMGLDKAYRYHEILGSLALIGLLFHPVFLVLKFIPKEINLAIKYLLPSSTWSVNFGIISLTGMILLVFLTYFITMKYGRWRAFHRFLGVAFIFGVLHVLLIAPVSKGGIFPGYYTYAIIVSFIGIYSFFYRLYFDFSSLKKREYIITEIKKTNLVYEITMKPKDKRLRYNAGQFASFSFHNDKIDLESHPFTIASSPHEDSLKIDVKVLGDYTENFHLLGVGDLVKVSGPHGEFSYLRSKGQKQIWIAGGIGVTPFISMAKEILATKEFSREIIFIYTSSEHFVEEEIFNELSRVNPNFKFISWDSKIRGKLSYKKIKEIVSDFSGYSFFISGPVKLKEEMKKNLNEEGIGKKRILEEDFEFK